MAGPKFDAEGLRDEWDKIEGIRLRLRRGKPLLAGTMSEYTISRCVENTEVLTPVLLRSVACDHKRPEVELLREEIENLLMMNQREFSESHIDDMAWEVRKLLTFVKRKAQRQEVPDFQDLCLIVNPELQELVDERRRPAAEDEVAAGDDDAGSASGEEVSAASAATAPMRTLDTDETQVMNILDCATPPDSVGSIFKGLPATFLRDQYQHGAAADGSITKPMIAAPEPIAEASKPIAEPEPIAEAPQPMAEAPKPIAEPEPIAEAPEPLDEPIPGESTEVLTRRQQMGLRKRKKDVNRAAKASTPAPKNKIRRKKSGLCKLRKSKRALASVACGSRDPLPEADDEAWWSRADDWVWDDELNNYVKLEKGQGYISIETPEDEHAEPASKRAKTTRRVRGKTPEAESEECATPAPKPKAKAKAKAQAKSKAKASPKASPKGAAKAKRAKAKSEAEASPKASPKGAAKAKRAKAKSKAEASPKASPKGAAKAKAKLGRRCRESTVEADDVEDRDLEWVSDWVRETNLTGSLDDFKQSVKPFLPDNSCGYRCNIYWTTAKCGVTLRYTDESGEKKQTDLVTYGFGKTRLATAVAVQHLQQQEIVDPNHAEILPVIDYWLTAGRVTFENLEHEGL
ncbi:unnamed protein product [Symbiodinium microadriaticum]|nr:unnamed protein product [Symbiodinium microadriaticum]